MTAQDYISSELRKVAVPIVSADIGDMPLDQAILSKVLSKKYRKNMADQPAVNTAKKAIKLAIEAGKPIRLMLFFGGNKLWRLEEAPNIDWGELFSLLYYISWAKSIARVYEPGVIFEYFSMDICIERMNNIPHEQTDQYNDGFIKMLEWAKPYIPARVIIKYTRYGDLYKSRDDFYRELNISKQEWLKNNDGKLPELNDAKRRATELNVKLSTDQDRDLQWREKVELEHRGLFGTKTGGAYMNDPSLIPNCPTWYSGFIATGSTKRSLAKFWVGVGALEPSNDGYNQIILTPKQLETVDFEWVDTNIKGLVGKNFSRIRVLKNKLGSTLITP